MEGEGRVGRCWWAPATAALVAVVSIVAVGPVSAHDDDIYEFTGAGWGHSVGMSQYGAYGQALEGSTADQIVQYYYEGTEVRSLDDLVGDGELSGSHPLVADDEPLWVGIRQTEHLVEIAPVGGPMEICRLEPDDSTTCVEAGWVDDAPDPWSIEIYDAAGEGDPDPIWQCRVASTGDPALPSLDDGSCRLQVRWGADGQAYRVALDGDRCADPADGLDRECFAHGTLQIRDDNVVGGFHVALAVGLEDYLYGLGEMPSSWPAEALRAQALAGRSYAVFRLLGNADPALATIHDPGFSAARQASCWCHMYATVADQNYVGFAKEGSVDGGDLWVAAVDATAGQVITHPSATLNHATVIQAFYHSSSGGWTETNVTVWNGGPVPYLQEKDDHWSNEEAVANPFASWTFSVDAATLAAALGWDDVHLGRFVKGPPAAMYWFSGEDDGVEVSGEVSAATLYAALGTRSPHIIGMTIDRFLPFLDIENTVHQPGIIAIWEAGITNGCGDGLYCPYEGVTRAQMATFLARALGLTPIGGTHFADVATGGPHDRNINAIAEAGISVGCAPDLFCPDDIVSRAQMATFLARALELEPIVEASFTDVNPRSVHAQNINAIAAEGISKGCELGLFCPDDPVTREQMATFLARAFLGLASG